MTRLFHRGKRIDNIDDLCQHLSDSEWIYFKERPVHPGIILHMNLNSILDSMKRGFIYTAIRNKNNGGK